MKNITEHTFIYQINYSNMERDDLINNKPEGEYMPFIDDDYVGNDEDKNDDGGNFLRGCLVAIGLLAIIAAIIIGICYLL